MESSTPLSPDKCEDTCTLRTVLFFGNSFLKNCLLIYRAILANGSILQIGVESFFQVGTFPHIHIGVSPVVRRDYVLNLLRDIRIISYGTNLYDFVRYFKGIQRKSRCAAKLRGHEVIGITRRHLTALVKARTAKGKYIVVVGADSPGLDILHRTIAE